jgi:hypothetical protein
VLGSYAAEGGKENWIYGRQDGTRRVDRSYWSVIQLAQSERMFTKASNLFTKKWNKKEPKFIEYFQNEWLNSHDGWYEGIKHLTPSTNNGLESNNRAIQ